MIKNIIEKIAPGKLAYANDPIGLQIGSWYNPIKRIMVTLDVDEHVVDEAIAKGVDFIYTHHSPLYRPLERIITDTPQGRTIAKLLQNNITIFTAHTNLDIVDNGVNDILAQTLGLRVVDNIRTTSEEKLFKLAVFVPIDYKDIVLNAITEAGAGWIGNYSHCSFQSLGRGTFMPRAGSEPFIGSNEQIEQVDEVKLETVFPESLKQVVIEKMLLAHPYEEVAHDIYELQQTAGTYGIGRIGIYDQPVNTEEFLQHVKQSLQINCLNVVPVAKQSIQKVAVCGGSGGSLLHDTINKGVDVYLTGEASYHDAQIARDNGLLLISAGHYETEFIIVRHVVELLRIAFSEANIDIDVIETQCNKAPTVTL